MNFLQGKKYRIIKLVYRSVLAAVLLLAFIFSLIATEPRGKLNPALNYQRAYSDLTRISQESRKFGSEGHANIQQWLTEKITEIGFSEHNNDLQLTIQTSESGYWNYDRAQLPLGTHDQVLTFVGAGQGNFNSEGMYMEEGGGDHEYLLTYVGENKGPLLSDGEYVGFENQGDYDYALVHVGQGNGNFNIDGVHVGDMQGDHDFLPVKVADGTGGYARVWIDDGAVTNFIATVRGSDPLSHQKKALLITSHYDGQDYSTVTDDTEYPPDAVYPATTDAGVPVVAMLEVMRYAAQPANRVKNDVIFLISDGEEVGLRGAKAFMQEFIDNGIDPRDRIGLVANFEATGTSGTLLMFETGAHAAASVRAFAPILGNVYTNSLTAWIYDGMPNVTDLTEYKEHDLAGLNFANVGSGQNYHTPYDNMENLSEALLRQNMNTVLSMYQHFGNFDFEKISGETRLVYFNFYNWGLISFPVFVLYIFFALMLLGLVAALVLNRKKLTKSAVLKTLKAIGIVFGCIVAAIGVAYLFSYIMQAITGVWLIQKHSSFGIVFGQMLISIIVFAVALYFLAKLCKVKRREAYTATAILLFVFTAALSFALPEAAFIFLLPAFVSVTALVLENTVTHKVAKTIITDVGLPLVSALFAFTSTVTFAVLIAYALGTLFAPALMLLPLLVLANFPLLLQEVNFKKLFKKGGTDAKTVSAETETETETTETAAEASALETPATETAHEGQN
ncbi:MAG: M28 family peptidase [Firmicutes bacterium]|nr:M28 family peptidase [Bacillota bacterium]